MVGPTRDQRGLGVRCNNNWPFAREAPCYSQSAQAAIVPSERGTSPPGARRAAPPPPAADLLDEFFGNVNTCVGQLFSLVSRMLVPLAGRASQSRTCGRTSGSVPRRSLLVTTTGRSTRWSRYSTRTAGPASDSHGTVPMPISSTISTVASARSTSRAPSATHGSSMATGTTDPRRPSWHHLFILGISSTTSTCARHSSAIRASARSTRRWTWRHPSSHRASSGSQSLLPTGPNPTDERALSSWSSGAVSACARLARSHFAMMSSSS